MLRVYDGNKFKPIGQIGKIFDNRQLKCRRKDKEHIILFQMLDMKTTPILGNNAC